LAPGPADATLESLDLRHNQISDEGAMWLGRMIRKNRSLRYLNLSANRIGPKGIAALARALRKNAGLTHVDLGSVGALSP
jgi:Ran GTPase-activating protein (RanGAP) involved in mRNA processing and transport